MKVKPSHSGESIGNSHDQTASKPPDLSQAPLSPSLAEFSHPNYVPIDPKSHRNLTNVQLARGPLNVESRCHPVQCTNIVGIDSPSYNIIGTDRFNTTTNSALQLESHRNHDLDQTSTESVLPFRLETITYLRTLPALNERRPYDNAASQASPASLPSCSKSRLAQLHSPFPSPQENAPLKFEDSQRDLDFLFHSSVEDTDHLSYTSPGSNTPQGNLDYTHLPPSISTDDEGLSRSPHPGAYHTRSSNTSMNKPLGIVPALLQTADHVETDPMLPSSSKSNTTTKKKKSKMHECEVCGKMFPRPSGLKTHMNTHNNLKPFPCGFSGCPRTFTVRSNAKRHLRTHGISFSAPREVMTSPYAVGPDTPTTIPAWSNPGHSMTKVPFRVRWIPQSLSSRTNVQSLRSLSDNDSDSDDERNKPGDGPLELSIPLPVPFHRMIPFPSEHSFQRTLGDGSSLS